MWRIALGLIYATVGAFGNTAVDSELYFSMMKYGIQPEIIPFCPLGRLSIEFASGVHVNLGNAISPSDFKGPPAEILYEGRRDSLYTLVYIDVGVSSRVDNNSIPFLQWLVVNIPGTDISQGEVITPYVESPNRNQLIRGYPHRFLILMYLQPDLIENEQLKMLKRTVGDRAGFSVADFLFDYGMAIPAFGNFYLAKTDSSRDSSYQLPLPLRHRHFDDRNSMIPNPDAESSEEPIY